MLIANKVMDMMAAMLIMVIVVIMFLDMKIPF